jgi:UDP-glucose 4-epimerase
MNCLVTGGCGFIGKHLVKALLEQKHEVTVWDIANSSKLSGIREHPELIHQRIDIARHSLHPEWLEIDWVFHLAAVSRTVPAMNDPVECIRTNVLGTARLLEAARKANVKRVVVSSSNVVLAGQTPYRDSKRAVEEMCKTYIELYKQPVIALRYSNVYGPGIPKGDPAVFAMLRDSYQERGYVEITGDGRQTRDFTHVSDIVRGNILATESHATGIVDLCTGVQTSLNDACKLLGIPVHYISERPGDIRSMEQDGWPAEKILGWVSEIELREGIQDIWRI